MTATRLFELVEAAEGVVAAEEARQESPASPGQTTAAPGAPWRTGQESLYSLDLEESLWATTVKCGRLWREETVEEEAVVLLESPFCPNLIKRDPETR